MTTDTAPAAEPAARYSVPALEKGLDILELLAATPAGMNVTAMSARLGRSTGELYRIVQYLEHRGYIDRNRENDGYTLSFRLFQLSHEHPPIRSLTGCAAPVMEALVARIGQSCHLAVRNRAEAVIVAQVDSPLPIRHSVRLGASFPVWETSSGLMLCAHLAPAQLADLREAMTPRASAAALAEFDRALAHVRARGFERRDSRLIAGITNLSRPVWNHQGDAIAALTVPYLGQRGNAVTLEQASDALAEAALAISRALGFRTADAERA